MSAPTCVSCGKAFAANGELVSLPEGRRIAFDPGQRRVWRICTKCGEWNLLGAEAAGEALAELIAREPKASASLRSTRVSGDLELLRIDDISKVEVADLVMAEQRDGLRTAARLAPFAPLIVVAVYAISWLITPLFFDDPGLRFDEMLGSLLTNVALVAGSTGMISLPRIIRRLRHHTPVPRRLWLWVIGSQVCLLVACARMEYGLIMAAFMYLAVLPTFALISLIPWQRFLGRFLPRRFFDATMTEDWDAMAIRWTVSPPLLELKALGEAWLSDEESKRVLESAVGIYAIPRTNAAGVQHAHALAASLGVSGVLAALDEWRHDRDDTLTLADIPAVYLVALQLAFSREKEASKKALAAHEKLLEADTVAVEAERLDRPPGGS